MTTIKKSQGQTFRRTGLLLSDSVFTHGQLDVGFSRSGYPPNDKNHIGSKFIVQDTPIQGRSKILGDVKTSIGVDGVASQNIVLN